jgi:hypothetical protein
MNFLVVLSFALLSGATTDHEKGYCSFEKGVELNMKSDEDLVLRYQVAWGINQARDFEITWECFN